MAFLITAFRTRFRYRLRDSEATYKYADSVIDAWGNAALTEITALIPHILGTAVIDGDAAAYSFDMSLKTRFHLMHRLSLSGTNGHPIPEHPAGIEYIRGRETGEGIIAGGPNYCVVLNQKTLYLDAIISATDDLDLEYWQTPRTWIETVTDATTQSTSPDGLLLTGQDELILGMACVKAGLDIRGGFGKELVSEFYPIVYGDKAKGLIGLLERFKQLASTTSHKGNKGQMRYSAMGADPTMEGLLGR
jgi:hypothetical protein